MANVKQTQQMNPLITCEIPFGQDVCELVFGVDVFDLDFGTPEKFDQTANQEQLCGFWKRVSLLDFCLSLSS